MKKINNAYTKEKKSAIIIKDVKPSLHGGVMVSTLH